MFLDTPGLHEARGAMNRFMVQAAWQALSGGDVILLVLDAPQYAARPESMDKDLALLREPVQGAGRPSSRC